MRVVKLLTVGGIALILTLGACSSDSGPSAQSGGPTTTEPGGTTTRPNGGTTIPAEGPTTSAGGGSSADICATVGKLGKSIAAVRGDSPKEAQAKLDAIQQNYEAVKRAAGGELSIQAGDVGQAMADLENEASTGGSQASDKLAKAYDRLDAAAGCP
jgi:hypothetical protein